MALLSDGNLVTIVINRQLEDEAILGVMEKR